MIFKTALKYHIFNWALNSLLMKWQKPINQPRIQFTGKIRPGMQFSCIEYDSPFGTHASFYDCQIETLIEHGEMGEQIKFSYQGRNYIDRNMSTPTIHHGPGIHVLWLSEYACLYI